MVTAKLFFIARKISLERPFDSKYDNLLYGFNKEVCYERYDGSQNDEFLYNHIPSPELDNFGETSPHNQSSEIFYGPNYYRTPSPYSMGPYFVPPSYPQGVSMNQNVFTMYHDGGA